MTWSICAGAVPRRSLLWGRVGAVFLLLLLLRGARLMPLVHSEERCAPFVAGPNANLSVPVWTVHRSRDEGECAHPERRVWQRGYEGPLTFASSSGVPRPAHLTPLSCSCRFALKMLFVRR